MSLPVSSLGYALLGLVHEQPRSGYALRKVFETTPMGLYSSSPGSIYPALAKLEAHGLLTRRDQKRGAPYQLTEAGLATLRAWVLSPVTREDVERRSDLLMLRLAFMDGIAAPSDVIAFLDAMIDGLEALLATLTPYLSEPHIRPYGHLALRYGAEAYRTQIKWARKSREDLEAAR
jgi:DNA-binding PadR family transcriptional regulator